MRARALKLMASASSLAGLAAVLAILPLSFPYPIIPYLKFDIAEIPVFLAFLMLGPGAGIFSSTVYWLILLLVGSFTPLGPTMKFVAVFSTLIGLWIGFRARLPPGIGLVLGSALGCVIRVAVMSIFNYLVLLYMFPEFLDFASASISAFLGVEIGGVSAALTLTLIFTAIFNILHVPLSIVPAYLVVRSLAKAGVRLEAGDLWYIRLVRAASRRSPQRS